jgi:hypothetical protein
VLGFIYRDKIDSTICLRVVELFLGYLGCARSAQQGIETL